MRIDKDSEDFFSSLNFKVRDDLREAFFRYRRWLSGPGEWWTGAERVAMVKEALVDAAGVVAQFEAINRVADATGTRIDEIIGQAMNIGLGPSKLPEPERF
jgi:hypothetical protein